MEFNKDLKMADTDSPKGEAQCKTCGGSRTVNAFVPSGLERGVNDLEYWPEKCPDCGDEPMSESDGPLSKEELQFLHNWTNSDKSHLAGDFVPFSRVLATIAALTERLVEAEAGRQRLSDDLVTLADGGFPLTALGANVQARISGAEKAIAELHERLAAIEKASPEVERLRGLVSEGMQYAAGKDMTITDLAKVIAEILLLLPALLDAHAALVQREKKLVERVEAAEGLIEASARYWTPHRAMSEYNRTEAAIIKARRHWEQVCEEAGNTYTKGSDHDTNPSVV